MIEIHLICFWSGFLSSNTVYYLFEISKIRSCHFSKGCRSGVIVPIVKHVKYRKYK